jgi:hypothetical protein
MAGNCTIETVECVRDIQGTDCYARVGAVP